ncbi:MAG: hypothetical protein AB8F95_00800 [Bacteroidia bacterium]
MKKRDFIQAIPLAILILISAYAIATVLTTNYRFQTESIIGFTLLGVSTLLFFIDRKIYTYIFLGTLILGTFNLVAFTTTLYSAKAFGVFFQPVSLAVLGIFLSIMYLNDTEEKRELKSNTSSSQTGKIDSFKVVDFKYQNRNLSEDVLKAKMETAVDPNLIEALKQIEQERSAL